jgi:hypothetical protein
VADGGSGGAGVCMFVSERVGHMDGVHLYPLSDVK